MAMSDKFTLETLGETRAFFNKSNGAQADFLKRVAEVYGLPEHLLNYGSGEDRPRVNIRVVGEN